MIEDNERLLIERKLHDPTWRHRLHRVQDIVHKEFANFGYRSQTLLIRTVVPRYPMKELPSVLGKIHKNRKSSNYRQGYFLNDIEDFIGIKVLCPYELDKKEVFAWMKARAGFKINPRTLEDAKQVRHSGYRGHHFTIRLTRPLTTDNEDLIGIVCDVQLKTMLEEAWDAKTHDVTYKREIDPELQGQMKMVGDLLADLEKQTEKLRQLILDQQNQEYLRKQAAAAVYLGESKELLREIVVAATKLKTAKYKTALKRRHFDDKNVLELIPVIQQYRDRRKLSNSLCRIAALVGLYAKGENINMWVLDLCDELIHRNPGDPRAYLTKAAVCWSMNRLDDALDMTRASIKLAEGNEDVSADAKASYTYWVAEKIWSDEEVDPSLVKIAMTYIDEVIRRQKNYAGHLDTKGFLLIATGSTEEHIKEGLRLVERARKKAIGTHFEVWATKFSERHKAIAQIRLSASTHNKQHSSVA